MEKLMKKAAMTLTILGLLLIPLASLADANLNEWVGRWSMNHDGHVGTLIISDSKMDCGGPAWCSLTLRYIDSEGASFSGNIDRIDDRWQHMVFFINFRDNRQKFDAYIFSWDKSKLAGTTYWGGRTFGLYAIKR
ncbi:MAG: hypothetical protein DMF76_02100 [Acidobacteria bacterium]|nr:MAG: hypothetical protein DMF76_02100 [Acidobacteriota bacterium]